MSKYLVFDLETEVHAAFKRKASAYNPDNWIVMRGWKKQGDTRAHDEYFPSHNRTSYLRIDNDVSLLVGFNLKFDLTWEMAQGNPDLIAFFKRGGKIWDCQYAEYLIEGMIQEYQMCSLDQIIEKYGGRKKIDEVKILWNIGTLTSNIPEDLLRDYLIGTDQEQRNSGDIGNTELIFLGQIKRALAQGQIKMIQDRMDGLLCTTEMEFNGLKVDVKEAGRRLQVLMDDLRVQNLDLQQFLPDDLPFEFNWGSRTHTSCLIYGGTVRYEKQTTYIDEATGELARLKATEDWPLCCGEPVDPKEFAGSGRIQDTFLSGKRKGELKTKKMPVPGALKVKYQDFFYTLPGYTIPNEEWKLKTLDGKGVPTYGTGSDIIEELSLRNIPFLKSLVRKQTLDKEIGTYYVKTNDKGEQKGMLTCVQPVDHMIHHSLNHSSTSTSRLSANNPNMQNIPTAAVDAAGNAKSEVKKMFVSRFGLDGVMIEADYSQLEVVVQGVLSGDPQLCQDLRDKIDFHCKRVAAKNQMTYEEAVAWCKNEDGPDYARGKKERTKCKVFSFQRAYGAGAVKIAFTTGMDVEEVKALMEAEDIMYPGVVEFNAKVEEEVYRTAVPFNSLDEDTGQWKTYRRGQFKGPTGTIYSFRTWNSPEFMRKRGVLDSFSPPELKNYPVQGTGGEFVQAVLGLLWRHFISTDNYGGKAYLVNTVHDCVWIDCHRSVVDTVAPKIKEIMESIPEFYNSRYNLGITVPFPVEVEVGPNMQELKHWHPAVAA